MLNFDFHTAVQRNIISIVKPTRCTSVLNLFYFVMTHYMFRTVFTSIITATGICQTDTAVYLLAGTSSISYPLASIQKYLFDKCLLLYLQSWTPDNGRKDRPKHVVCHYKIKYILNFGACSWFYYSKDAQHQSYFYVIDIATKYFVVWQWCSTSSISILLTLTHVAQQYTKNALLHFHGNNVHMNVPLCYFICTLTILLQYIFHYKPNGKGITM